MAACPDQTKSNITLHHSLTDFLPVLSICYRSSPCSDRLSPEPLPPALSCCTAPLRPPPSRRTPWSPPPPCRTCPGWRHRRPGSPRTPCSALAEARSRHNLSELFQCNHPQYSVQRNLLLDLDLQCFGFRIQSISESEREGSNCSTNSMHYSNYQTFLPYEKMK